jgi:tetratricopeptide (TPR) repeat protein
MRAGRLLRSIAVAACFVLAFEAVARQAHLLDPTDRPDPYLGFPGTSPLYRPEVADDGSDVMRRSPNKDHQYRPEEFPATKPAGEFRVFCIGGSSVRLDAFMTPDGSFSHMLEMYLQGALPRGMTPRVINAGGGGAGSVQNLETVREALDLQPDLLVVYPEGGEKNLIPPAPQGLMARADDASPARVVTRRLLAPLRLYVAAREFYDWLLPSTPDTANSLSAFSAFSMYTIARPFGPESFSRLFEMKHDSVPELMPHPIPAEEITHAHARFVRNLETMGELAHARGVPLLFVYPVRNIKASLYLRFHVDPSEILPGHITEWHQLYADGLKKKHDGQLAEAIVKLRSVRKQYVDDRDEILAFDLGECFEQLQRWDDAREEYEKPYLRHPMRALIAEAAQSAGVPTVDPFPYLIKVAEHGLPGFDEFTDSFHPMPKVSRIIARAILDGIRKQGIVPGLREDGSPEMGSADQRVQGLVASCRIPIPNRMYHAILDGNDAEAIALGRSIPVDQLYSDLHIFEAMYLGWALTRTGDLDGARAVYDGLHASKWTPKTSLPPLDSNKDIITNAYGGDLFSWF